MTLTTRNRVVSRHGRDFEIHHPDGRHSFVGFGGLPAGPESDGLRARAAELRERAARILVQAENADACADLVEIEERNLEERAQARKLEIVASREKARRRRADPFGFAPWATATRTEITKAAVLAGVVGVVKGRAVEDVRADLSSVDPGVDLLTRVRGE